MPKPDYLCVRDFEKLQHYRDRALIWIKLHVHWLDQYEFQRLPDEAKFHLFGLMLLAARMGNRLPNDAAYLARQIGANSEIQIELLLQKGFLIPAKRLRVKNAHASKLLAESESPASADKDKDTDTDEIENRKKRDTNTEKDATSAAAGMCVKTICSDEEISRYAKAHDLGVGWEITAKRTGEHDDRIKAFIESRKPLSEKWREKREAERKAKIQDGEHSA